MTLRWHLSGTIDDVQNGGIIINNEDRQGSDFADTGHKHPFSKKATASEKRESKLLTLAHSIKERGVFTPSNIDYSDLRCQWKFGNICLHMRLTARQSGSRRHRSRISRRPDDEVHTHFTRGVSSTNLSAIQREVMQFVLPMSPVKYVTYLSDSTALPDSRKNRGFSSSCVIARIARAVSSSGIFR